MARKRICTLPVDELDLEFEDGKIITLRFDVEAMINFYDFDDGVASIIEEKSIPKLCAKIIYIGAKNQTTGFTYDDALKITSNLSPITITEIINEFNESMGNAKNGIQSEQQKKLMEDFLIKMFSK